MSFLEKVLAFLEGKKVYILASITGIVNILVVAGVIQPTESEALNAKILGALDTLLALLIILARRATSARSKV